MDLECRCLLPLNLNTGSTNSTNRSVCFGVCLLAANNTVRKIRVLTNNGGLSKDIERGWRTVVENGCSEGNGCQHMIYI